MGRGKVLVAGAGFVDFDNDEARGERGDADGVEEKVREGSCALLFGRVRRLQDEGCLDGEEEAGLGNFCINDTVVARGLQAWSWGGLRS